MNKRTTKILLLILNNENDITIADLAESFNVSPRTIRNDIYTINSFLNKNLLSELSVATAGSITFEGDKSKTIDLVMNNGLDFYTYKLDKDERKEIISLLLLDSSDFITISAIADELCCSRQTIINDLEDVKKYFISFNLKVQSNSNKGLRIIGTENCKRNMMLSIIYSNISFYQEPYNIFSNMVLSVLFKDEPKEIFERIIKTEEKRNDTFFTDASYLKVLYYCMLIVKRMRDEKFCTAEHIIQNSKYDMSLEIIQYICNYFHIDFVEDEVIALSEMLISQRYTKNYLSNDSDALKIQMITTRFISALSEDLKVNLNADFIFYENLIAHLEATLVKEFNESDSNPVLDILKQNYQSIFEIASRHVYIFNEFMGREMNDHELSYVVLHICASIERKKRMETPAKVIVVCGGRIGTSQLLIEKLKQQFNFDILAVTSVHNLSSMQLNKADLVISTVPLHDLDKDHVIITPILNDSDYLKIHKKLKSLKLKSPSKNSQKQLSASDLMNAYNPIISKYLSGEQAKALLADLKKATQSILNPERNHSVSSMYLYELLNKENILLDVECKDYREAIQVGGGLLVNSGAIEPAYIEAMIRNTEENGPYFVISKGFAVPHAPIDCGVNDIGMSLIRLKEPITFFNEEVGKIEYVCCLSAIDAESHTKALFDLINLLDNNNFKEALATAETPEELADLIKWYEEDICGKI